MTASEDEGEAVVVPPQCVCHGISQIRNGYTLKGIRKWRCAVKSRAKDKLRYEADPASENYRVGRSRLRTRITAKRQRIQRLEASYSQEDTSGIGES